MKYVPSIKLRVPLNRTIDGPRIDLAGGRANIWYDYENDDGSRNEESIVCDGVVYLGFTIEAGCTHAGAVNSFAIQVVEDSPIEYLLKSGMSAVLAPGSAKDDVDSYRHHSVYFDNVGVVDVVCKQITCVARDSRP